MLQSVRARLTFAFAAIVILCLALAGSAFVVLLSEYQSRVKLDQLGRMGFSVSSQVRLLERFSASPAQISAFLSEQAEDTGVRFLLADRTGQIVYDSGGQLVGEGVELPTLDGSGRRPFTWRTFYTSKEGLLFVLAVPQPGPFGEAPSTRPNAHTVFLALPESSVRTAWVELAPSLLMAGGLSLLISTLVAFFVSRSISRPIARVTAASEEMARGRYDQFIPVSDQGEIGRLASAFNAMARQVSTSHRTLRDFLANVSHELKTPLTSIQGFSQAMIDGSLRSPADFPSAAAIVNQEANRMSRLVEDLLFLSKIESGQIAMRVEVVDLAAVIREVSDRFERNLNQHSADISVRLQPLPPVTGDAHWLGQMLANLIDNARKFASADSVVTISAQPVPHGAAAGIQIAVHNPGSFIPPHERTRVFERFYQLDKSRARGSEGSGLGLAIVREIVLAHHGDVVVESDQDGTSFVVWLPAIAPVQSGRAARPARAASAALPPASQTVPSG